MNSTSVATALNTNLTALQRPSLHSFPPSPCSHWQPANAKFLGVVSFPPFLPIFIQWPLIPLPLLLPQLHRQSVGHCERLRLSRARSRKLPRSFTFFGMTTFSSLYNPTLPSHIVSVTPFYSYVLGKQSSPLFHILVEMVSTDSLKMVVPLTRFCVLSATREEGTWGRPGFGPAPCWSFQGDLPVHFIGRIHCFDDVVLRSIVRRTKGKRAGGSA